MKTNITFDYTRENQPTAEQLAAMPVPERRVAFLQATAVFYYMDNRASIRDAENPKFEGCVYPPTETSPGCAVGRWLTLEVAQSLPPGTRASVARVFQALPQWMQELDPEFLDTVQRMHDLASLWDKDGLTPEAAVMYRATLLTYEQRI